MHHGELPKLTASARIVFPLAQCSTPADRQDCDTCCTGQLEEFAVISTKDMTAIYKHIDDNMLGTVESLKEYVRHPSVSVGNGEGMHACAELVARRYRELGCTDIEIVDTCTFPGVYAYFDAGAPLTLLNYNMYDVRSVGDLKAWTKSPFDPVIEPLGDIPAVMYGRGALTPKGADTAWLAAIKAIKAVTGTLPVNIIFLAEGDEILGSPSYVELIERYRTQLAKAQGLLYLRGSQNGKGEVPLVLGYKSFITFEIEVSSRNWGRGATGGPAHSALRTLVDSPALRLCQVVSSLYDANGKLAIKACLPHLEKEEAPQSEKAMVDALLARFAGKPWADCIPGMAGLEIPRFVDEVTGPDVLTRYIYGSALNIQGIYSGYTGPGSRTFTIPETATARFDARLVTSEAPEVFLAGLRQHLDEHGFGDVNVRVISAYPSSRTQATADLVQSWLRAVEKNGGKPVLWPGQAYGGPWSLLARDFGMPVVFGAGIGHGANVGLPDEYVVVDGGGKVSGMREMARFSADLIADFAATAARRPA
jgi:acetylornithine deacetylase/succinyl-diaminopimelate desuccinylase-like protein